MLYEVITWNCHACADHIIHVCGELFGLLLAEARVEHHALRSLQEFEQPGQGFPGHRHGFAVLVPKQELPFRGLGFAQRTARPGDVSEPVAAEMDNLFV